MPRALLSVSDKSGIVEFAKGLNGRGFELVSTGGTALTLERAGLPVIGVSTVTGFPEMLDGRVKTLAPARSMAASSRGDRGPTISRRSLVTGSDLIDLVVVNLYPFVKAAQNPETAFESLIEEIDIGGPSLVRAAAKNFADVIVVVSPSDYAQRTRGSSIAQADHRRAFDSTLHAKRSRTPRATTLRSHPRWRGTGRRCRVHACGGERVS